MRRMSERPCDRLKRARKEAGYATATAFHTKHGIPQSTYSMHESGRRPLDVPTAEKYGRLLNVSPAWLLYGSLTRVREKQENIKLARTPVVGQVQAGAWVEAVEWPESQWSYIDIPPDVRFPHVHRFGLKVVGPSMDELYPDGSIVICVSTSETGRIPNNNERVVIERHRPDGLIEATIKEYRVDGVGHVWLWPRSTHPEFQLPIRADDGTEDGTQVRIIGLVIGSYRPE